MISIGVDAAHLGFPMRIGPVLALNRFLAASGFETTIARPRAVAENPVPSGAPSVDLGALEDQVR
jgi:hypothetical protein